MTTGGRDGSGGSGEHGRPTDSGGPKWTDIVSAVTSVLSTAAVIWIAVVAHGLDEQVRDLTFPEPLLQMQMDARECRQWLPGNVELEARGSTLLHVAGHAGQDVLIDRIECSSTFGLSDLACSTPRVTLALSDHEPVLVRARTSGLVDTSLAIDYTFEVRAASPEVARSFVGRKVGVVASVSWLETRTHRNHSTPCLADSAFSLR
jgi:hypothetical protein